MGLSVAISGGIILTVFMLILLSLPGFVDKMFSIGDVTSQVAQLEKSISDTEISMNHVSTLLNEPTLNFTLKNDGQQKLWNFKDFDMFVTYEGIISDRLTQQITYGGDCLGGLPAQGTWCIESITGDMLDPGILNTAESANIRVVLDEDLANVNAIVSISTDNGVTDTVLAPYCGPSCYQIFYKVNGDEPQLDWSNMGAALADFNDNPIWRTMRDLTDMTEWRYISVSANSLGTATCETGAQFSIDGGNNWLGLDNGIADSISTATNPCDISGFYVTAWTDLNSTAQTDVWLRVVGQGGNGIADPDFGTVEIQFRS